MSLTRILSSPLRQVASSLVRRNVRIDEYDKESSLDTLLNLHKSLFGDIFGSEYPVARDRFVRELEKATVYIATIYGFSVGLLKASKMDDAPPHVSGNVPIADYFQKKIGLANGDRDQEMTKFMGYLRKIQVQFGGPITFDIGVSEYPDGSINPFLKQGYLVTGDTVKFDELAVSLQGMGIAQMLLERAEVDATNSGAPAIILAAVDGTRYSKVIPSKVIPSTVTPYYLDRGYHLITAIGPLFMNGSAEFIFGKMLNPSKMVYLDGKNFYDLMKVQEENRSRDRTL